MVSVCLSTEDRYTWILEPQDLKGNTGRHYLVVRPIVGPGIRSINASLSIASITTACQFWDEPKLDWNNYGCRVSDPIMSCVTHYPNLNEANVVVLQGWRSDHTISHTMPLQPPHPLWELVLCYSQPC